MRVGHRKRSGGNRLGVICRSLPAVLLLILVVLVFSGKYVCPVKGVFGIDCPGCRMTRAIFALLRLDIKSAFELHGLFPLPIFWASYCLVPARRRFSRRTEAILLFISMALFILRWFFILIFT